jgi:fructose-1,6-bisphosphatase/inositol monophosphatase family enzyme
VTGLPVSATGKSAVDVARECAREAGALMRAGFGRVGVSAVKGRGNVLTETDLACEAAVHRILGREYPGHAILSEETAADTRSDGWLWVVDPVDGTKNFSRGIPHFCFSIALCLAGEPLLGLTYQPLLDEEILAVDGEGCTLNGQPCAVTACERVVDAVVALDMGYNDARGARQLALAQHLWPGMQSLRVSGSAALGLAWVAAGRWDVFVHLDLQPWDIAAGLALVREAGGIVTDRDGAPATIYSTSAVAAGPALHGPFMALAGQVAWRA